MTKFCYAIIVATVTYFGGNAIGKTAESEPTAAPAVVTVNWHQSGPASWYGGHFNGRKTSNGERFSSVLATCAHRSLPFGTILRVTVVETGVSATCKVNDRGPYSVSRHNHHNSLCIVDLAEKVARTLGIHDTGIQDVRIERLSEPVEVAEAPETRIEPSHQDRHHGVPVPLYSRHGRSHHHHARH